METRTLEDWRALLEAEKTLDSGVYNKHDLLIVRGQGARVWDAEGNEYIDCVGGYGVANLGHSNPEVVEAVKRVARRAGLKDWQRITPHKLRHSYASALVEAGRGIDEVKELLGHSSISTTQVYVHVSRKRLEEAARALPDVVG